jgi:anhydro-N-acetylmuramic acid kinase
LGNTIEVHIPSKIIIEFKEALIFALMGALRIEKKINVLSSVTGAKRDSSSGVIYMPN